MRRTRRSDGLDVIDININMDGRKGFGRVREKERGLLDIYSKVIYMYLYPL